jgi:hypothetical protein
MKNQFMVPNCWRIWALMWFAQNHLLETLSVAEGRLRMSNHCGISFLPRAAGLFALIYRRINRCFITCSPKPI